MSLNWIAIGLCFHLLACMSRHCAKIYEIIRFNGVSDYFIFLFYFYLNLKSKLYIYISFQVDIAGERMRSQHACSNCILV